MHHHDCPHRIPDAEVNGTRALNRTTLHRRQSPDSESPSHLSPAAALAATPPSLSTSKVYVCVRRRLRLSARAWGATAFARLTSTTAAMLVFVSPRRPASMPTLHRPRPSALAPKPVTRAKHRTAVLAAASPRARAQLFVALAVLACVGAMGPAETSAAASGLASPTGPSAAATSGRGDFVDAATHGSPSHGDDGSTGRQHGGRRRRSRGQEAKARRAARREQAALARVASRDGLDDVHSPVTAQAAREMWELIASGGPAWRAVMLQERALSKVLTRASLETPCNARASLPLRSWAHYFAADSRAAAGFPDGGTGADAALDMHVRVLTHRLSLSLTVALALQQAMGAFELQRRRAVTVHLIGVSQETELADDPDRLFLELTRVLCHMVDIRLVMVGPEVPKRLHGTAAVVGHRLTVMYVRSSYEAWANSHLTPPEGTPTLMRYTAPDAAVAVNAGLRTREGFDEWRPAVELLLREGMFAMYTAPSELEFEADWYMLVNALPDDVSAELRAVAAGRNPFGSLMFRQVSAADSGDDLLLRSDSQFFVSLRRAERDPLGDGAGDAAAEAGGDHTGGEAAHGDLRLHTWSTQDHLLGGTGASAGAGDSGGCGEEGFSITREAHEDSDEDSGSDCGSLYEDDELEGEGEL